eukprot:TRINITY_DN123187_c0_g1_i1.p1 TRINITY_DN123187_c0_g1~~TRINITY_DN123187_c0_g1_i1.p1  ORF type:complete len:523 (+),score=36.48 TRINITY_DN123187_c0_g1_i1:97-1665(+)
MRRTNRPTTPGAASIVERQYLGEAEANSHHVPSPSPPGASRPLSSAGHRRRSSRQTSGMPAAATDKPSDSVPCPRQHQLTVRTSGRAALDGLRRPCSAVRGRAEDVEQTRRLNAIMVVSTAARSELTPCPGLTGECAPATEPGAASARRHSSVLGGAGPTDRAGQRASLAPPAAATHVLKLPPQVFPDPASARVREPWSVTSRSSNVRAARPSSSAATPRGERSPARPQVLSMPDSELSQLLAENPDLQSNVATRRISASMMIGPELMQAMQAISAMRDLKDDFESASPAASPHSALWASESRNYSARSSPSSYSQGLSSSSRRGRSKLGSASEDPSPAGIDTWSETSTVESASEILADRKRLGTKRVADGRTPSMTSAVSPLPKVRIETVAPYVHAATIDTSRSRWWQPVSEASTFERREIRPVSTGRSPSPPRISDFTRRKKTSWRPPESQSYAFPQDCHRSAEDEVAETMARKKKTADAKKKEARLALPMEYDEDDPRVKHMQDIENVHIQDYVGMCGE